MVLLPFLLILALSFTEVFDSHLVESNPTKAVIWAD